MVTEAKKQPFTPINFDFADMFPNIFGFPRMPPPVPFGAMDIHTDGDKGIIEVCLPGIRREDIKVTIKNRVLVIEANIDRTERKYLTEEIKRGPVRREVKIGDGYIDEVASANYENGMLRIVLVYKPTKEKKIDIK